MSILSDALTQCGFPSREEQIAAVTLLHAAGAFTNDAIPESMLDTVSAARFIDEGILDTACSLEGDAGSYLDKWENASVEPLNHTTMRIDFADISKAKIWLNSRGQQSKATLGLQERHQLRVSSQLEVHYEACLPFLKTLQLGPEKPIAIQPHGFAVVFGGGPSGMQSRFDALQQYCLTSDTYPEHIFCLGGARDLWPPTGRDDINGEPAMIPLFIAAIKRAADKRGDLDVPTEAFLELQFETIFAESDPLKPGPQRKACIEWAQATYPGVTWPTEADIMNNLAMNHPFFQTNILRHRYFDYL